MGFWKEAFKERVVVKVLAGGHMLVGEGYPFNTFSAIFTKGNEQGMLVVSVGMDKGKSFKFSRISWERLYRRSLGKTGEGALVGTVLAGPVGTIAGAMIGGRRRDDSAAFLYLIDPDDPTETEYEIHIQCSKAQYTQLANLPFK